MDSSGVVNYVPILLIFVIAAGFAAIMITMSRLAGRNRPTREKLMPYESGVEPVGDARARQSVKFYMVAMVFLLFDIEAVFLIPWAVAFPNVVTDPAWSGAQVCLLRRNDDLHGDTARRPDLRLAKRHT